MDLFASSQQGDVILFLFGAGCFLVWSMYIFIYRLVMGRYPDHVKNR